ncbi:MAG: energy transducer TonB [Bacteroidota bacterium]
MNTFSSFSLWGTLILFFSGCCLALLPQAPVQADVGLKEGLHTTQYSDGSPKMSANYSEGIFDGTLKSWYPNGQLRYVREYAAGKRIGLETVYYPDGQIYRLSNLSLGNYKTYHPNGKLKIAHDSIANDSTHYYYRWNSAGVLIESVPLVNGKQNGPHQWWSAKGILRAKGTETEGIRTGLWEYFDELGNLVESHDYGKGTPIQQQQYAIINETVPNYRHDGYSYPAENDNVFGTEETILDWPGINDYFTPAEEAETEEPKPINMGEVQRFISYPQAAREGGIEGNVVMRVLINTEGNAVDNRVITQVSPVLSNQVEFYLMDLKFSPASINGEAIPFWVNIPFNFKLLN